MITVMLDRFYYLSDISFPSYKIIFKSLRQFEIRQYVDMCDNKPRLQHWVLVADSKLGVDEFALLTRKSYGLDSHLKFRMYSIFRARSYGDLRKKFRSTYDSLGSMYRYVRSPKDRLFNLRWTSSKMIVNDFGEIVSFTSPILLFSRYKSDDILVYWASGFRSLLADGRLEVRKSFYCFSLGSGYH